MFFGLIIALLQVARQAVGAEHAVPFALNGGKIQSQIQIENGRTAAPQNPMLRGWRARMADAGSR